MVLFGGASRTHRDPTRARTTRLGKDTEGAKHEGNREGKLELYRGAFVACDNVIADSSRGEL